MINPEIRTRKENEKKKQCVWRQEGRMEEGSVSTTSN